MSAALSALTALTHRATSVSVQDKGRVFNTDLVQAFELQSLLDVAETIVASALAPGRKAVGLITGRTTLSAMIGIG